MSIRAVYFILTMFILLGCTDKWDQRYKEEAKDKCDCLKIWQSQVTSNLENLYQQASSIYSHNDKISEENYQAILQLKSKLSTNEKVWNHHFGAEFRNRSSALYNCWNRLYDWSAEYPGNNTKNTVLQHASDANCSLVVNLLSLGGDRELFDLVFE